MPQILPPTRAEKWSRALGYVFVSIIGFSVLFSFPGDNGAVAALNARGGGLGVFLATVWALFLTSALVAAPLTIMERWRAEFVIIPLAASALAVALFVVWSHAGSDPLVIPRASASTALLFFMAARFFSLFRLMGIAKDQGWKKGRWMQPLGRS
jgi:hypothetical protein